METSAEKVWLTQHLDSRYGNHSGEIMLCNLAFGTRILANAESWDKLSPFQVPQPPSQDAWLVRARDAHLLVGDGAEEVPDTVVRLLAALKTYLKTDIGSPLQLLDQAEAHYRQHHMPGPYTGPAIAAGPLMHKPSRLVDFIFDHTRAFLSYDLKPVQGLDLDLVRMFCERPAMKLRYEQQFCTPHTTQLRARKIAASVPPGGRVLVLGDDDLVSLALVHYGGDFKVDVLELDTDLVAFLKAKGGDRLTVLEHNLRHGVPESMRKAYDVVTTDPPYAANGMRFFLQCAADSLVEKPDSLLFLSTYPGLIESPEKLWTDLDELGLKIEQRWEHFSRYIYNNTYRVEHLAALRQLGSPLHPTSELLGFPYLYAHFFECSKS
ncbi:bis-aminopropyl spermidine synthase family protein [bacterium]|nr:bis-aminopropyl spermidine synthase family protein [bacterium]